MPSFSRILAADLGASAVRILELGPDAKGRPGVLAFAEEELSYDPLKTSDFFPIYTQALSAALLRLPSKTRACHLCLGGPAVFSRILKVPAADPSKVASLVGFEAHQTVPAIEQALWDYQLLSSPQPGEVEALILAIKKDTVDEMAAAANAAGLKPSGVTLTPAALLNAFYYNYPEAEGCNLILEIGTRATTIVLVEGARLFVRVVPLGGATLTQGIATDLQESFAGAELLKKAKGFVHPGGAYEDSPDPATARISKLARGVMTRLLSEVERSVTFFRNQQAGGKPHQVWLTGGGVALGYTDIFFREKLRIPVNFLQPFRRLSFLPGLDAQAATKNFSRLGVVAGTALQALPDSPVRINVLGEAGRAQLQKRRETPPKVIAAMAAGLLLFLPGLHGFWQGSRSGKELAQSRDRIEEANRVLETLESDNKKLLASFGKIEAALRLEEERLRWPLLLQELKRHCPKGLWITGLKVLPPSGPEPGKPGPASASAPPVPLLEIAGMFETRSEKADAEAVANFQKSLEGGGRLSHVTVLEREAPQYVDGKTDQVALRFRLRAEWPQVREEKGPKGK